MLYKLFPIIIIIILRMTFTSYQIRLQLHESYLDLD